MNYQDLDNIITKYEETSCYNIVYKTNGYSLKEILGKGLIILTISTSIYICLLYKFQVNNFNDILVLLDMITSLILFFLCNLKLEKLKNQYIKEYVENNSLDFETFDEIQFNEFYNIINSEFKQFLLDKNFNLLISYLESKENQLFKDPEYGIRITILISSIITCIAALISGIIPQLIQDFQYVIKIAIIILIIIFSIIIYYFRSSLFTFPTKKNILKSTYKNLKGFLYKSKFRYELEHKQEDLNNTIINFNNANESSAKAIKNKENFKKLIKTKFHKVIDILLE